MQTRQARCTSYLCPSSSSGPSRPVDEIETGNIGEWREEMGTQSVPSELGCREPRIDKNYLGSSVAAVSFLSCPFFSEHSPVLNFGARAWFSTGSL